MKTPMFLCDKVQLIIDSSTNELNRFKRKQQRMKTKFLIISIAIITIVFGWYACSTDGGSAVPDKVSYNFHIRPILSDKCFACYGPDKNKRKADFRLDIEEAGFAPLKETKGAFVIVRGKPEESELYKRITSKDPNYMMPSPDSHFGSLSEKYLD